MPWGRTSNLWGRSLMTLFIQAVHLGTIHSANHSRSVYFIPVSKLQQKLNPGGRNPGAVGGQIREQPALTRDQVRLPGGGVTQATT